MTNRIVYQGRTFTAYHASPPTPASGHVVIDVAYTGLCGTDLHIFHGAMDQRIGGARVIGHEMSGIIREVGPDVSGWAPGDPVTVMPLVACGDCPACDSGQANICYQLIFLGIDAEGSMQQYWSVPASTLVPLPKDLPLRSAALVEPTAVAVHDVRRAGVQAGESVVVVGGGPVGTLIALIARQVGASVVLVEPDEHRRSLAASFGLSTLNPTADDVQAWIADWTGGAGAAVAFEVSGSASGVTTAVDSLATRGRLCMVAIHPTPREVNLHRFFWRELTLVGARLYDRTDFEDAAELLTSGAIPVEEMITRVVPLANVEDAFAAIESGAGVMKVLLDSRADA